MKLSDQLKRSIKWNPSDDAQFPYSTVIDGQTVCIRLNDFPAEKLYTLIVGELELDFDDWPPNWIRSGSKKPSRKSGVAAARLVKTV